MSVPRTAEPSTAAEAEVAAASAISHSRDAARRQRIQTLGLQVGFVVVVVVVWEAAVDLGFMKQLFVSKPSLVAAALVTEISNGRLLGALVMTLYETGLGFFISAITGFVSGLILFESPLLYRASRPFITLANNLPRLALAPLFVLYFSVGSASRVALVISLVYVVVLLNTFAGLQNSDRDHLLLAKALGASRLDTFIKFVLPNAVPTIFVGLQLGLTYAFLGAVVGEMLTGGDGLGAVVATYMTTYSTDKVFADLILMAIVATALSGLMRWIEARLLRWRRFELRGLSNA